MTDHHPALDALQKVESRFPQIWSTADDLTTKFYAGRHLEGSVFSLCEAEALSLKLEGFDKDRTFQPALLGALVAWRPTQGIYRYHSTLYEALIDTDLQGDVPSSSLLRMPGWAVFIETPPSENMLLPILGFWAYLSRLGKQNELELVALCRPGAEYHGADIDPARDLLTFSLPIGNHPVSDLTRMMFERRARDEGREYAVHDDTKAVIDHVVSAMLSLLLYLCSEQPDISGWTPPVPKPKFFGTKRRWLAAKETSQWDVGLRIGAALDLSTKRMHEESASEGGTIVRPHVRRAHWHSYWIGKRGEQTVSLRWLPPIPVNVNEMESLPAVIHPVHGEGSEREAG